ncbi:TetR family transcriptional regulator [Aeromicrobium sp. A1-2]|uniref:TetR/AcrR family transcriptional regulator n=1 Tax=Aeromicrobium sp. A1-2 TaxID=2107713 RepID=UPI000E495691|nr:TetR/AcrR family transcriptional regulator [Aeromicrobium sp. A1-2]AXT86390.1 TetR family transcriptional regulator [Aeromicrobium sp. A1-2]
MSTPRRQQILDTAASLFAERGFHGVSVHDIGSACGISGPALYKHFAGKDDILTQSLTAISEELLAEGVARAAAARSPEDALEELIAWHIDFALGHPALIVIQEREWANLDAAGRKQVRLLQLAYVDIWVDVVLRLRDDLDASEARAAVQATFGLLNSTPHSARISEAAMRSRLALMARSALRA